MYIVSQLLYIHDKAKANSSSKVKLVPVRGVSVQVSALHVFIFQVAVSQVLFAHVFESQVSTYPDT
ncbi:hypothetical protein II582_01045 [bacterium]|nr:hypothetical protein [bacterium]